MTREELLRNAKPILFNTDMVKAILRGQKTVTRRVAKGIYPYSEYGDFFTTINGESTGPISAENIIKLKSRYQPGDMLYVRETWSEWTGGYIYRAKLPPFPQAGETSTTRWYPSIHMPKAAARIFIKVLDVRVERLQDITEEQAKAEGCNSGLLTGPCTARGQFENLWNSTIKEPDFDRYGWNANPWVWVIEFERIYPT